MSDERNIQRILVFTFPDETDALGTGTVVDIIAGDTDFEAPKEGKRFDVQDWIQLLAAAVAVIRATVDVARFLWAKYKREPSVDEVKAELKRRTDEGTPTKPDDANAESKEATLSAAQEDRIIKATLLDFTPAKALKEKTMPQPKHSHRAQIDRTIAPLWSEANVN